MYEPGKVADLPTTSPNAPLDQPRQDLWDAAQLLRKHGHCKSVLKDSEGRLCWAGAILRATGVPPETLEPGWSNTLYSPRTAAAVERFNHVHRHTRNLWEYVMTNNAPETTAERVIMDLELAALS